MFVRTAIFGVVILASTAAIAADPAPLRESSVTVRQEMQKFGICVADASPEKASKTLLMDFRSNTYESALRNLAKANDDCFRRRKDAMRAHNLSFAGAIAERLIERDASPLNARLIRGSAVPANPRTPSDAIAFCVVRSAPDDVAKLFATDVATDAERAAVQALQPVTKACSQGQQLTTNNEGLRAMLATAAFRTVTEVAEAN